VRRDCGGWGAGDPRGFRSFGTYSAPPPVDGRTAPDVAGLDEDRPPIAFVLAKG